MDRLSRGFDPRISNRDAFSFPGLIAPYIELADSEGVPWRRALQGVGVDGDPADPAFRVRISQVCRFLDSLAAGDLGPDVTVAAVRHDGAAVEPPTMRMATRAAPSLLQALCGIRRHALGLGSHFQIWFHLTPSHLWICTGSYAHGTDPGTIHSEVLRIIRLTAAVQAFAGDAWRPEMVGVTSPAEVTAELQEWLGDGAIQHDLPFSVFPVPVRLLQRSERTRQESATTRLGAADGRGAHDGEIGPIHLLDAALPSALAANRASLDAAAEMVGMSPRTLQRYLGHLGTSYRTVVSEARVREARRLLLGSTLPIEQIAHRLGYWNHSSFTRAFRRWCGLAPSEVRRLAPGDDTVWSDDPGPGGEVPR